jgi:hypothetical protein
LSNSRVRLTNGASGRMMGHPSVIDGGQTIDVR